MKTETKSIAIPPAHDDRCYACDSGAIVGVRDRRAEGGVVEAACRRHADPAIPAHHSCAFCAAPLRRGSYVNGTDAYHKACASKAARY